MSFWVVNLPDLTISNAGTTSNAIGSIDDAEAIVIYAPATLTGTVTVQVEPTETGTAWVDLTSGGSDVTIAAGNSVTITEGGFRQLRLSSSAAEGAARVFSVTKQFLVNR